MRPTLALCQAEPINKSLSEVSTLAETDTTSRDLLSIFCSVQNCLFVTWNSIQDSLGERVHISDVITISLIVFMACAD